MYKAKCEENSTLQDLNCSLTKIIALKGVLVICSARLRITVLQVVLYIVGAVVWNLFATGEKVFD
jgi:hypothetical protein